MTVSNTLEAADVAASSGKQAARRRGREPLTKGERAILDALKLAIQKHGQPTVREIAALANYDISNVHRNLVRLADKGLVEKTRKFRGIRLVRPGNKKVTQ